MHLIEAYAANTGLRIGPMNLFEMPFPLGFDNEYVIFVTGTGAPGNCYDHWKLVLNAMKKKLHENGYKTIQVGGKGDERIGCDLDLCGQTSTYQYFWLVKNCSLLLSSDTSALHVAGHYNRKLVSIFGISSPKNSGAYFGDRAFQRYIPANDHPTFMPGENPKVINTVKPERVLKAASELLGIEFPLPSSLFFGAGYRQRVLVSVPDSMPVRQDFFPESIINIRLDRGGSFENAVNQLKVRKCQLFTDKALDVKVLSQFGQNLEKVIYIVRENDEPNFVKELQEAGISYFCISYLEKDKLNEKKLSYADYCILNHNKLQTEPPEGFEEGCSFQTNRIILSQGKVFLSFEHLNRNISIDRLENHTDTVLNTKEFWEDKEFYHLFKQN